MSDKKGARHFLILVGALLGMMALVKLTMALFPIEESIRDREAWEAYEQRREARETTTTPETRFALACSESEEEQSFYQAEGPFAGEWWKCVDGDWIKTETFEAPATHFVAILYVSRNVHVVAFEDGSDAQSFAMGLNSLQIETIEAIALFGPDGEKKDEWKKTKKF